MVTQKRIRDYGYMPGILPTGPRNKITDVPGVTVGHSTIREQDLRTGVTVILPAQDNVFTNKLTAACYVHNGFGKTCGLMQIEELGSLETPIALTNTLNVGLVHDAMVDYTLSQCDQEGLSPRSLNPLVAECNDGKLSNIAKRPVRKDHVFSAIKSAAPDFQEGAVGGGTGMICYGLKGGIGSASRQLDVGGRTFTLGILVQSNFGATRDFTLCGHPIGPELERKKEICPSPLDTGSIITVLATDLPVSSRQLRRILRRCGAGLARTGSFIGNGSGEVMVGFTTANRLPVEGPAFLPREILREDLLDIAFRAAAEATEEAVLNSMITADTTVGYQGDVVYSLREFLETAP